MQEPRPDQLDEPAPPPDSSGPSDSSDQADPGEPPHSPGRFQERQRRVGSDRAHPETPALTRTNPEGKGLVRPGSACGDPIRPANGFADQACPETPALTRTNPKATDSSDPATQKPPRSPGRTRRQQIRPTQQPRNPRAHPDEPEGNRFVRPGAHAATRFVRPAESSDQTHLETPALTRTNPKATDSSDQLPPKPPRSLGRIRPGWTVSAAARPGLGCRRPGLSRPTRASPRGGGPERQAYALGRYRSRPGSIRGDECANGVMPVGIEAAEDVLGVHASGASDQPVS